jgi:hypothetical protein
MFYVLLKVQRFQPIEQFSGSSDVWRMNHTVYSMVRDNVGGITSAFLRPIDLWILPILNLIIHHINSLS